MSGPCMCGDPYCPRCGNPAAARLEEELQALCDDLHDCTEFELHQVRLVAKATVEMIRATERNVNQERAAVEAEAAAYRREQR